MEKDLVTREGRRRRCRWTISSVPGSDGEIANYTLTFAPLMAESPLDAPGDEGGNGRGNVNRNGSGCWEAAPSGAAGSSKPTEPDLEANLEKSRVESLALLAGGIAHDFNNVLQTILTSLSLAKLDHPAHSPARAHIESAVEATQNAQSLAQQILDFTKGRRAITEVANLGDLLRQVGRLSTMGSNVRCDISTPEGLWGVEVDLRQVRQVVYNIMINACQAMPSGGVIQASVENRVVSKEQASSLPPGPYVVLRIRDRGCGIAEEDLPRIFDPYYTTKENGTGIGLATCKTIIQRHRGAIEVSSKVNAGTEFQVFLPAAWIDDDGGGGGGARPEPVAEKSLVGSRPVVRSMRSLGAAAPVPAAVGQDGLTAWARPGSQRAETGREWDGSGGRAQGRGMILVVDDQDSVREAAEKLLGRLGYRTVSASSGQEAVTIFRQHSFSSEPISAVLLDMTLPGGLSGDEVMDEIRKVDNRARVIATSGYFDDDAEERFVLDGYVGILPKPYAVERLSQKLDQAIGIGS
jgi:CheY-like chemotaxis protein